MLSYSYKLLQAIKEIHYIEIFTAYMMHRKSICFYKFRNNI